MKLSKGCAYVIALAAFAMTGSGAIAADQTNPPGEGCDLRNTPGCKPGEVVQPLRGAAPGGNYPAGHPGGKGYGLPSEVHEQGDQPHSTPTSPSAPQ
jgi:hypothetical protein